MVGNKIRSARKTKGVSQAKLALLMGIKQAVLSQWELGKVEPTDKQLDSVNSILDGLDENQVTKLKKKRVIHKNQSQKVLLNGDILPEDFFTRSRFDYRPGVEFPVHGKKALALFSGCGGFTMGVKAAGFSVVGFVELERDFRAIYQKNFPDALELGADITKITDEEVNEWKQKHGPISLVYEGPPCQGFSLTGKRDVNDERNTLFQHFVRIIDILKPECAIIENVRLMTSMKSKNGNRVPQEIIAALNAVGYSARFQVLNAQDYGVPQFRERVFFIALGGLHRESEITFPARTHGTDTDLFTGPLDSYVTFGGATGDLEDLESGEASSTDPYHFAIAHLPHVIDWLRDVPEGCSAHDNEDPAKRPPSGYNTTYKRLIWNEPSSTISTTFGMISGSRNVHPRNTRSLTIREALRCQSFPDYFKLVGNLGAVRMSIGNAVPPLLAKVLARHVFEKHLQ